MNRAYLQEALGNRNVQAFLRVLREGETSQQEFAYRMMFGGDLFEIPPWDHPRRKNSVGSLTSTAAGAYQFLERTWDGLVRQYGFPDFSPECQDEAAVALVAGRKALDDVIAGRFDQAVAKCNKEWASLPGSPYGQPVMTIVKAAKVYEDWGGAFFNPDSLETERYDQPEASMAFPIIPLLTAFGPELVKLIPQFATLLGSGSEVQVRNAKAAEAAVSAVVNAVQAPNLQAAIEKMQQDPEAVKTAQMAAADVLSLVEMGGGIVEARKASSDPGQLPAWKNPAVWFMAAFVPLIYGTAYLVLTGSFSDDAKMMVVTAIFTGLLASGTAFFLGSSLGSQRKTNMLVHKE